MTPSSAVRAPRRHSRLLIGIALLISAGTLVGATAYARQSAVTVTAGTYDTKVLSSTIPGVGDTNVTSTLEGTVAAGGRRLTFTGSLRQTQPEIFDEGFPDTLAIAADGTFSGTEGAWTVTGSFGSSTAGQITATRTPFAGASQTVVISLTRSGAGSGSPDAPAALNPGDPPVQGKSVSIATVSGKVRVRNPGGTYRDLGAGEAVPVGAVVDAGAGRVRLVAQVPSSFQAAEFYAGVFKATQPKGEGGLVELGIVGKPECSAKGARAGAHARKKKKPRIWGDGKGKFRTRGASSSATVRGTRWLVEDRCDGTYTKVDRGTVAVRDFVKKKTVIVKAPKSYLARKR